jgi:transglutaminase-like putative cysteine protease
MGCYYIYDNDLFRIQEFVKDWKKVVIVPDTTSYKKDTTIDIDDSNTSYIKEISLHYVQNTTDFVPDDKQELLNIYYTALNSGWDDFTFYCPDKYKDCLADVKSLSNDTDHNLSNLNSFVNPYNIYNNIYTTYYETGKVTLKIKRLYDSYMIDKINTKLNELYSTLVNPNTSIRDNIKAIHDYIINNTVYDTKKTVDINDDTYSSNTAYGVFYEGVAVCSGYADAMALFLNKMNVPNIKVATDNHVWNLVYIDNKWYHLDLTWDDPVTTSGKQILSHSFFLIDYDKIKSYNTGEHDFNPLIYQEAL